MNLTFNHNHRTKQPAMRQFPRPDASPTGTTSSLPESVESVTYTDKDNVPHDNELTAIQLPSQKRQKTKDGGGKVSSVSNLHAPVSALLDLPLDVLLEILTHVDPMSLRHVSRTSHALRDTLTGPQSNWIWRASYANTDHGLPPAPDDVSVPQFLSLLVDEVCDVCHASPDPKDPFDRIERIWAARTKYCRNCWYYSDELVREENMTCFPMVREMQGYVGPQYPLYKIFPASEPYCDRCTYRRYPRVLAQRVANEFSYDTEGKSKEDKKAWIVRQAEKYENVIKHAELCHKWEKQEMRNRQERKEEVRKGRLEAIKQRLWDLEIDVDDAQVFKEEFKGLLTTAPLTQYDEERTPKYFPRPVHSTPIAIYNLVGEARSLTEEDWSTIQDWLLQAAKAEKRRQILEGRYSAFKRAYRQFLDLKSYRKKCLYPSICTLANWDDVVDLIEGTPLEQDLSSEDMRAFINKLAEGRFSRWRAAFEAELVAKLNAADTEREHPATRADLKLATSVFSHKSGSESYGLLWYPDLLGWYPRPWGLPHPVDSYYAVRKCPPWSAHEVQVEGWRRSLAARMVSMARLDPATATFTKMNYQLVWFARTDEVAMLHHGKRAFLQPWHRAMIGAREGDDLTYQPVNMFCYHWLQPRRLDHELPMRDASTFARVMARSGGDGNAHSLHGNTHSVHAISAAAISDEREQRRRRVSRTSFFPPSQAKNAPLLAFSNAENALLSPRAPLFACETKIGFSMLSAI
ncbi:uncharacterized protein SCHCODRAFT_02662305 [Schizophyllum commune H4-8]|nr:uncharacterized protein SCHCODRAFT_02662305 [Schizophyllum commune H4-8]KAI5900851.1 hypothetical protein SCHCODRAFT_02662305 [Schizophyllum commune H4-8]